MKLKFIFVLLALVLLSGCTPTAEESGEYNGEKSSDSDQSSVTEQSSSTEQSDADANSDTQQSSTSDEKSETQESSNTDEESETQESSDSDEDSDTSTTTTPTYSISTHNQGANCLTCHEAPARNADGEDFKSGATVYNALNGTQASSYANGYAIRLVLDNAQIINYSRERGTGNSYSDDNRLSSSYTFTAQVVDSSGTVVNTSATNSHDYTRVDCNTCHTATGNNSAPGRITSYNPYATGTTTGTTETTTTTGTTTTETTTTGTTTSSLFENSVLPVLSVNCKTCHTTGTGRIFSVTDAAATYSNIIGFNGIDITTPANSLLLTKALGTNHGGGKLLDSAGAGYIAIRDWIATGETLGTTTVTTPITTPVLITPVPTTISFSNSVFPILNNCKVCHGTSRIFIVTTAAQTYSNILSFSGINTTTPTSSLLLTKASGVNHGGHTQVSNTEYGTIRDWITQGALNN